MEKYFIEIFYYGMNQVIENCIQLSDITGFSFEPASIESIVFMVHSHRSYFMWNNVCKWTTTVNIKVFNVTVIGNVALAITLFVTEFCLTLPQL